MSDALRLPPRPHINQYKTLARELQRACKHDDAAVVEWAGRWVEVLLRLQGHDLTQPDRRTEITRERDRIARRWREFVRGEDRRTRCLLADAQFFVAREHGFASWPKFAAHIAALGDHASATATFETAVDAIVAGDVERLREMLHRNPSLVRARSTRDHHSTLLHYVSANGIEDFRQKTPPNIVEITRVLLDAGADVNATSEAYGGGSTALGLAATSLHPQRANVQIPLLALLLDHGAAVEQGPATDAGGAVAACLGNGQPGAAEFLVSRGAVLNLEGAAGLGRLDVVRRFVAEDGTLAIHVTRPQLERAFFYACGYGHPNVVRYLMAAGVDPSVRNDGDETGLHWASFGPHPDVARALLSGGASTGARDRCYNSTPLDWALFAWSKSGGIDRERGYELVATLVEAGATAYLPWVEAAAVEQARADARMWEILRGAVVDEPPIPSGM